MPERSDPDDDVRESPQPSSAEPADRRSAPMRPAMSNSTPPPIQATKPTRPPIVGAARTLWFISIGATLITIGVAYLIRNGQIAELRKMIVDLDPDGGQETIDIFTGVVFTSCLIALGVIALIEIVLVGMLLRRRHGVRWVLLPIAVLNGAVSLVVAAFAALGDPGLVLQGLLLVAVLLAGAATVVGLLPGVGRWIRGQGEPERSRRR